MRIAIVNDLSPAVEILRRIVLDSAVHQVAWVAHTGEEAIRKCEADTPDLILMDLFMPDMGGVEATRRIMVASPCPILVVTATLEDHAGKVFEAMGQGALDAINTPHDGEWRDRPEKPGGTVKKNCHYRKAESEFFRAPHASLCTGRLDFKSLVAYCYRRLHRGTQSDWRRF